MLLLGVCLLLLVQYRIWFDDTGVLASRALSAHIVQIQNDNRTDRARNEALLNEVLDLKNDTGMLEEIAREELGLVGKDERFFLFAKPEHTPQHNHDSSQGTPP